MISIDSKILPLTDSKLRKVSKKDKKVSFNGNKKASEWSSSEAASSISNISGMIFLQEVDHLTHDKEQLKEFAKKAFNVLKSLQLDILDAKISPEKLNNLKNLIDSDKLALVSSELANFADEVKLRIEIEIAKIEVNLR